MKTLEEKSFTKKLLSATISLALIVVSFGPEAAAAVIRSAPVQSGPQGPVAVTVVPGMTGSMNVTGTTLSNPLSTVLPGAAILSPQLRTPAVGPEAHGVVGMQSQNAVAPTQGTSVKAAATAAPVVRQGAVPVSSPKTAPVAAAAPSVSRGGAVSSPVRKAVAQSAAATQGPAGGESKLSSRQVLEAGAGKLSKGGFGGRFTTLEKLFSGSKRRASAASVEARGENQEGRAPALSKLTIGDLEAIAVDSTKDFSERKDAVASIAKQEAGQAKAALERVAEANPEGGSQDYEIHRAALRALAETFKDVRSLRPISESHKNEILTSLEKDKPEVYFSDFDDTLEEFRAEVSPEIAEGIRSVTAAGVDVVILTDRQAERRDERDFSIMDSLATMTPEQKADMTVISGRGTEFSAFNKKGEPVLFHKNKMKWSAEEKAAIETVRDILIAKYGQGEFNGNTEFWNDYSYSPLLPVGTPVATLKEAAEFFKEQLAEHGIDLPVIARTAKKATDAPYLSITKIDKTIGVVPVRTNRRAFESIRDLVRYGLPARLAQAAYKTLRKIMPARRVSARKVLSVGDQFFDTRIADTGFVKGSPGGTTISVGNTADPRLDDVVVWPTEGREASLEIMGALGKQAPSEMNKKAITGLFIQRTASIAAFILTSIAYPFLAVPVVGWAGYGILMSFGPLAGIATGPLNGLIADRLSARNGMALNTAIRVISSLALPVLAMAGYLNFTTLLIASFANGWLLSSIMTTENAYFKRLAGAKNVFMISNLAWMNYLMIQVLLGLILGIGAIVDTWNPMVAFTINAAVNAFIVLPVIWFTMPNLNPSPKTLQKMEARLKGLETKLAKAEESAKKALEDEIAALKSSISAREDFLKKNEVTNQEALKENQVELEALRAKKAKGIRARLALRKEIKALEADTALREKTIADGRKELARTQKTFKGQISKIGKFLKNNWVTAALFGAGLAAYFAWNTTLPMIGALLFWITTTTGFKVLWYGKGADVSAKETELQGKIAEAKKAGQTVDKSVKKELSRWKGRLPKALLMLSLIALMMYPLQYLALPKIAVLLVGQEAKALVMGQLLGSLFFGNLIANAAQSRLPDTRLPLIGRLPVQRLIQAAVMGLGAAWVYTGLFPGSALAAVAAMGVIAGLMTLASKLTKRAWVKFVGLGFSAIWIPYLVWGAGLLPFIPVQTAMMLALLGIGMSFGPAYTTLMGYFFGNAAKDKSGAMGGVQGSFFNAAVSGGYALLALATSLMSPAFPTMLAILGALYLVAGLIFWRGPKLLPGLPKTLLEPKEKK